MRIKICQYCGKEVTAEGRSKFCCAVCQSSYYNKNIIDESSINLSLNKKTKICLYCGKEFEYKCKIQVHCSKECRVGYKIQRRRNNDYENIKRNCKRCGKKFETIKKFQLYCSDKCRDERKYYVIKCLYCGKEFDSIRSRQKFCNVICSKKWYIKDKKNKRSLLIVKQDKICKCCGKEFKTTLINKKIFCSNGCKILFNNNNRNNKTQIKECAVCGKAFVCVYNSCVKFCSVECKNSSLMLKAITKQCLYCGVNFLTNIHNKKYCNDECKKLHKKNI